MFCWFSKCNTPICFAQQIRIEGLKPKTLKFEGPFFYLEFPRSLKPVTSKGIFIGTFQIEQKACLNLVFAKAILTYCADFKKYS